MADAGVSNGRPKRRVRVLSCARVMTLPPLRALGYGAWLGAVASSLPACERANASHCGNQAAPEASCVQRYGDQGRTTCSVCTADHDGCVVGPIDPSCRATADGGVADTTAASTASSSSSSGDATVTSTTMPATTETGAASSGSSSDDGGESSTGATPVCGNGMVEGDEHCDGTDFGGATCSSIMLGSGDLGCDETCNFVLSDCSLQPTCGNGQVEGNEACDGPNLGDETCASLPAYSSGELQCDSCMFNTTNCEACFKALHGCADDDECCSGNCTGLGACL